MHKTKRPPVLLSHPESQRRRPVSIRALVAGLLLALASPVAAQMVPPTLTAIPSAPTLVTRGSFEDPNVFTHTYSPSWLPWVISATAGIARDGAPFLLQSAATQFGDCMLFIEGLGNANVPMAISQPGLYRVRLYGAQRLQGAIPDLQRVRVTFGGTVVLEQQFSQSFVEYCTTPIRVPTGNVTIAFDGLVASPGNDVALIDRVRIERVLDWQDPTIWRDPGGAAPANPPGANDAVWIPATSAIGLAGTCTAGTVEVQGDLVTEYANGSLSTKWVLVRSADANFECGIASRPFTHDFQLTLRGVPTDPMLSGMGTKFLIAMDGGRIDMHGLSKTSWSKLTKLGGSTILVTDRSGWQVGDEVLLVASKWMSFLDSYNGASQDQRSEVRTITGINLATGDITLASAPAEFHCAAAPTPYTNPLGTASWTVDQRAEVGMLSHNVRVQGDPLDSTLDNRFGAHVMMMNGTCCATPGTGYFANVQFKHMGQRSPYLPIGNALGRYPLHWHMQKGNGYGQYARGCSVWQSFNRAITIHGTDGLLLEDNVLFDHDGHGVFFEDGGERNNRLLRNLVVLTRRPRAFAQLLPHDNSHNQVQNQTPAAFWITNPQNEFIGNVAAHTVGTGYWFALHSRPTGASFGDPYFNDGSGQPIDPRKLPIIAFRDNTAHGCVSGLDVNDMIDDHGTHVFLPPNQPGPLDDTILTNISWDPPTPTDLEHFIVYGCSLAIYSGLGTGNTYNDLLTFRNAVLTDNETHIQLASAITVTESLLVENTGSGVFVPAGGPTQNFPGWFPHPGYAYTSYDGPGKLTNSHLVGFDGSVHPNATLAMSHFGASRRHPNHIMSGLTFANGAQPQILFYDFTPPQLHPLDDAGLWGIVIQNSDGSLTNGAHPRRSVITNHPMLHLSNGAATPDVMMPGGVNAWLSPFSWGYLCIMHWQQQPGGWWQLQGGNQPGLPLPPALFTRDVFQGWPTCSYYSVADDNQIRQVPIIMRPVSTPTAPVCDYLVGLQHPATSPVNTRRVDVTVDDTHAGAVVRMRLSNTPAWSNPAVYVNDANSDIPANWRLLIPVATAVLDQQTVTAFARPTPGEGLLRTANTGRRHQLTILW